jgi:hypothetical protein
MISAIGKIIDLMEIVVFLRTGIAKIANMIRYLSSF